MALDLTPSDRELCSQSTISRLENLPTFAPCCGWAARRSNCIASPLPRFPTDHDRHRRHIRRGPRRPATAVVQGFQSIAVVDGEGRFVTAVLRSPKRTGFARAGGLVASVDTTSRSCGCCPPSSPTSRRSRTSGATIARRFAQFSASSCCCAGGSTSSAVTQAGCQHTSIKTGSGKQAARTPAFKWVNTALGKIKPPSWGPAEPCKKTRPSISCAVRISFQSTIRSRNHPRLSIVALRTAPMPYRLLKLADVAA